MWGLWLSRGVCGILCTAVRTLRFLCFASLFALILLAGTSDQGGTRGDIEASRPPTAAAPAGNITGNITGGDGRSSGTITITMTGAVGDPGDVSQGK
jgi:hypothetical protein